MMAGRLWFPDGRQHDAELLDQTARIQFYQGISGHDEEGEGYEYKWIDAVSCRDEYSFAREQLAIEFPEDQLWLCPKFE